MATAPLTLLHNPHLRQKPTPPFFSLSLATVLSFIVFLIKGKEKLKSVLIDRKIFFGHFSTVRLQFQ